MKKFIVLLLIVLLQFVFVPVSKARAATAPDLGVANSYAVFGKTGVTNDTGGTTHIWGNVGADLLSNITNLISTQVDGTILGPVAGVQTAASAAYDTLDLGTQGTPAPLDLSGPHTVTPGVYTVGATTLNDTLTLNGAGVYIFRSSSSISTSGAGTMSLINGATACDVFWEIPASMTIGANAHIEGTIIAQTGLISLGSGTTLKGRALSLTKQVTLLLNQITQPVCAAGSTSSSTSALVNDTTSVPASPYCPTISNQIIAPIIIESRRVDSDSIFISWGPYSGTDTFNVEYGYENGKWLYNTNVTGFSTTINALHPNQPIWVRVTARNNCTIGTYGPAKLVGGSGLPSTGFGPAQSSAIPWYVPAGIGVAISVLFVFIQKERRFSSRH